MPDFDGRTADVRVQQTRTVRINLLRHLDARNVVDTTKLPERQNDFGGTLGGHILRNKTFFFFSYEVLRLRSPVAATLYQVPSNELRVDAPAR